MEHYVYRISNIKHRLHYYGVRSSISAIDDIGKKYFSSSSDTHFMKLQRSHPEYFKYKIIKIFNNRQEANLLEVKLHEKFDVGINEHFYNRAKQTSSSWDRSGIPLSSETKEKMKGPRISLQGRKHSEEHKLHNSQARLGKLFSEITKKKMSISQQKYKETHIKNGKERFSGLKNPKASLIKIFNNEGKLMYECLANFDMVCEKFNLPYSSLKRSYQSNGKLLFQTNKSSARARTNGYEKFIGWYALKSQLI